MKRLIPLVLVFIFASACSVAQPLPTPTQAPTITPTITITATPVNTQTPEPTATNEIRQYQVCTAENYAECEILYQDLFNGNYFNWLNTLSVEPFNPSKFNTIHCFGSSEQIVIMGDPRLDNFSNPDTSRVRRGITVGVTLFRSSLGGTKFVEGKYLVLPTYAYSESKKGGVWLPLIFIVGENMSKTQIVEFINKWQKAGSLWVFATTKVSGLASNPDDPLVIKTFELFPDMQMRLDNFKSSCDPGYLSEPGIILETTGQ